MARHFSRVKIQLQERNVDIIPKKTDNVVQALLHGMEKYVSSFYPSYFLHVGRHEQTHKTMRSQNLDHCYFVQEF